MWIDHLNPLHMHVCRLYYSAVKNMDRQPLAALSCVFSGLFDLTNEYWIESTALVYRLPIMNFLCESCWVCSSVDQSILAAMGTYNFMIIKVKFQGHVTWPRYRTSKQRSLNDISLERESSTLSGAGIICRIRSVLTEIIQIVCVGVTFCFKFTENYKLLQLLW